MTVYFVDGAFVPAEKAMIPVDDLAVLRGIGICDIMRTFHKKPYFVDEHIDRLMESGKKIGLALPWTRAEIKQIVFDTLEKNPGLEEVNIRIVITGGSSPDFITPTGRPRLIVMITPINKLPEEWYTQGIKVITLVQERPLAGAKVTAYIPATMALNQAKAFGATEVIYIDRNHNALEGTTSNLFAFFGDTLVTPPADGILKGITRKVILSLAGDRFEISESPIPLEKLLTADEVFITGTNKGVVPVVRIDDTPIGNGRPGPNTLTLMTALSDHSRSGTLRH
ncbi:MAG: aminotransferase class IV [Desulfotignum sp.]